MKTDIHIMNLDTYRVCMSGRMKGNVGNMSKTERKIAFSVSAKMCSGKAKDDKSARAIVKTDHPEWFK